MGCLRTRSLGGWRATALRTPAVLSFWNRRLAGGDAAWDTVEGAVWEYPQSDIHRWTADTRTASFSPISKSQLATTGF